MMVVVNFWAWSNICTDCEKGFINGYNRSVGHYGLAYKNADDYKLGGCPNNPWSVDYYFYGNPIKETEKAICFEVPCFSFNHRCDITKNYTWKVWIPKKSIIPNTEMRYFKEWGTW